MKKSDREIMEILEAFDLTRCAHSAADLAACDPKTVARYVDRRDRGHDPAARVRRPMKIDPYRPKIEELVERSAGRVRADIVHERLAALGFDGTERTTRRAVRLAKTAYRAGRRRTYRPWITEPGMWLQFDWGTGPVIDGRPTLLFCAWLAWSRFRVVIPTWDRTMGSLLACLDATLRQIGGVPTYLLTDNERTVTIERIARIPVRHPEIVAAGRHYGTAILACAPFDPESKGGSESTVKVAKADLVPTEANLLPGLSELRRPGRRLRQPLRDRQRAGPSRDRPATRRPARDRAASPPRPAGRAIHGGPRRDPHGRRRPDDPVGLGPLLGAAAVRRDRGLGPGRGRRDRHHRPDRGPVLAEIARHRRSTPGNPRLDDAHYPDHPAGRAVRPLAGRSADLAERRFLALGPGAETWLIEAASRGVGRIAARCSGPSSSARSPTLARSTPPSPPRRPPAGSPTAISRRSSTISPGAGPTGLRPRPTRRSASSPGPPPGRTSADEPADPAGAAGRADRGPPPAAPAVHPPGSARGPGHRPRPALGSGRGPPGPVARRGGRTRRGDDGDASPGGRLPVGQDARELARGRVGDPAPHPARAGHPRVADPGREPRPGGPIGDRQDPLPRGSRRRRHRGGATGRLVQPRVADRDDRPGQGRRLDRPGRRPDLPVRADRRRRHRDAARRAGRGRSLLPGRRRRLRATQCGGDEQPPPVGLRHDSCPRRSPPRPSTGSSTTPTSSSPRVPAIGWPRRPPGRGWCRSADRSPRSAVRRHGDHVVRGDEDLVSAKEEVPLSLDSNAAAHPATASSRPPAMVA